MGALAQQLREPLYFQFVNRSILYAERVLDYNHDGLLSVSEANKNPVFTTMVGNPSRLEFFLPIHLVLM
jgi:uncharacterized protein